MLRGGERDKLFVEVLRCIREGGEDDDLANVFAHSVDARGAEFLEQDFLELGKLHIAIRRDVEGGNTQFFKQISVRLQRLRPTFKIHVCEVVLK